MNKKRTLVALVLLAAAGIAAYTFTGNLITTVEVVAVGRGVAQRTAPGNVSIVAALDSRVIAPAEGLLQKFEKKEGDFVKKGEILGEIDLGTWPARQREVSIELKRVDERLEKTSPEKIRLETLREAHAKNTQLLETGAVTKDALEQSGREIEALESVIERERTSMVFDREKIKTQLDEINREIDRRTIRAGYDGVIMKPAVLQGDQLFAGNAICNLTSREKMVKVEVSQDDLDAVTASKRVIVKLFALEGVALEGELAQILPVGNSDTQRFTVFVSMKKPLPSNILAGQTGEATFIADEHPDALLIPRKAVVGGTCFVVREGLVEKRALQTGFTTLLDAEILSGLKEGELVVSKDADLRRDGEKVRFVEVKKAGHSEGAAPPSPAASSKAAK